MKRILPDQGGENIKILPAQVVELVDTQDLKSCGHCGRSGSTPLPGTKRVEKSTRFFITLYFNEFSVARVRLTLTNLWTDIRYTQIQSAQDK